MKEQSVKDLTKEQLLEACLKLQDQVGKSIQDQQSLIKAKSDLDSELSKFRIMNRYGNEILSVECKEQFSGISLEYFIELFNQAKGLFFFLNNETKLFEIQNSFGFRTTSFEEVKIDESELEEVKSECAFLSEYPELQSLIGLDLHEAYLTPFYSEHKTPIGLIIVGQDKRDAQFYAALSTKEFDAFNSFTQIVGAYYTNLNYRKVLLNAKEELEEKVIQRTKELKVINDQLHVQTIELKRSNEDLEKFASVVSHDLKSPMRNIVSFSQLLLTNKLDENKEDSKKYLGYITKSVSHLNSIINALLDYSKVSSGQEEFVSVDLNDLVSNLLHRMSHDIEENKVEIRCNKLPIVQGSKYQLERLFQNLIDNSIKFRSEQQPLIILSSDKSEDGHLLTVSDNGIGINEKYQSKIFELFQRLHNRNTYEGTGLGLSICKKIVERHNGKIWFESKGQGTKFYISLPINN